ncbi:MAG: hypothetical protein M3Q07_06305 [Pseudobdellovibrionaceae bacterium]|uniref:hypothetical protein n=1 Tax=Oligoflexus sp. TaxID=1971216 RepID=UPI0027C614DA|nr:hypothetical protein [Oligoflexus sp.]MDQ3231416.1 hypothetical protein [Pseudobdellovibrionaceae bacterium]HYX32374.1 hypothetical protein [Oligoflexus sp.]
MRRLVMITVLSAFLGTACVPDVYLIDRQTVLELEASGEWQELDQAYQKQALNPGPQPLESTSDLVETRQIFGMTHSDLEKKPAPKSK